MKNVFSKTNFIEIRKNSIKLIINEFHKTKRITDEKQTELLKLLEKTNVFGNEYRKSSLFKQLFVNLK